MTFLKEKSLLVILSCSIFSLITTQSIRDMGEYRLILLSIAFFFIGDGLFVFFRSRKKAVTNFFVFLCFHLSFVFSLLYSPHIVMLNIGLFLLSILPLNVFHFLGLFLQIRPRKLMYIFLASCCILFNVLLYLKIQEFLALAILIFGTFLVCLLEYRGAKKKNTLFFQKYRRIFIRSILIALLPFVLFWVFPSIFDEANQYTELSFFTILLILVLPITVTYILVKNSALSRSPNKKNLFHKALIFGGIFILFGIILFFLHYSLNDIIIILHLIFIASICIKIGEGALLNFQNQAEKFTGFSSEKALLDLQLTNSALQHHLSMLIVYVLKKTTLLSEIHILLSLENAVEEYSVVYSEGDFPQSEIEKTIRKKGNKIELLSVQENSYCILPLYYLNENLGWIIFGNNNRKSTYTEDQLDQFSQLQSNKLIRRFGYEKVLPKFLLSINVRFRPLDAKCTNRIIQRYKCESCEDFLNSNHFSCGFYSFG